MGVKKADEGVSKKDPSLEKHESGETSGSVAGLLVSKEDLGGKSWFITIESPTKYVCGSDGWNCTSRRI